MAYVVGQVAGIMIGLVMLRSDRFGRPIPYTLIAANVVGFARYLPTVGVAIAAFSGLVLWVGAGSSSWPRELPASGSDR